MLLPLILLLPFLLAAPVQLGPQPPASPPHPGVPHHGHDDVLGVVHQVGLVLGRAQVARGRGGALAKAVHVAALQGGGEYVRLQYKENLLVKIKYLLHY